MNTSSQMSGSAAELVDLLGAHPNGLTRPELLVLLRKKNPYIQSGQIEAAIRSAGDAILEREGRLFTAGAPSTTTPAVTYDHSDGSDQLPLRIVAFDTESVARLTAQDPYTESRLFQLGAVRFGSDREWAQAWRSFNAYMRLPADAVSLLERDPIRERYFAHAEPPADVLERFREFVADADVLVAYNGTGLDFPLLDAEYKRAEVAPLTGPRRVDGLYLALALWPVPPRQHRLRQLTKRLEIDVGDAVWHDALDDAKVLAVLLNFGAKYFSRWDAELRSLIVTAARESEAWNVLFALMPNRPSHGTFDDAGVSHVLSKALSTKLPLREIQHLPEADKGQRLWEEHEPPPRISEEPLLLSGALRGEGMPGTVDVSRLASAAKHGLGEPRQSQRDMVTSMREWVRDGIEALVEAPTGTGKSYAMLAIALEWLAADPKNRVVISTFTKQLQMQLAMDVEELARPGVLPQLAKLTDMVKGTRNRLSLRALVVALADLASPIPKTHIHGRAGHTGDVRFRELVLFLVLRFIAHGRPTEEWESRSVDPFDVPPFFDEYCGKRLNLYLLSLSQALAGELSHASGDLAAYAATVLDSLARHRLIIANHALLFANLDAFAGLGEHTLLMIDEAHALESTATTALSHVADSPALEALTTDLSKWLNEQPDRDRLGQVTAALGDLDAYLGFEALPKAALKAFDTAGSDPLGRSYLRKVTIASPLSGAAHAKVMDGLGSVLREASVRLGAVRASLRDLPSRVDTFENERFWTLFTRLREMDDALKGVLHDFDAALGRGMMLPATVAKAEQLDDDKDVLEAVPADAIPATFDEESLPNRELAGSQVHSDPSNRVVWAEELDGSDLARGPRFYRFRVASSPIELGREAGYRSMADAFSRVYYISATLRVAGDWAFIRERLALAENKVKAIALESPFDSGTQARLVCFEDFPSWAEQADGAVRTIAHQVDRYAREVAKDERNGVMVLTTARATAAGVADALVRLRARQGGSSHRITSTQLLGNQRAVETFREVGGVLVGTKGLWQGVDIAQPDRLRLVWINKLPFASFADPVIAARKALVRDRADAEGHEDPEAYANEAYYLPLAAIELRQAVGRLIRTRDHRGVIIISDRKLAGPTRLRRLYRQIFLGSLDPGLLLNDPETGEKAAGNVMPMAKGWRRIWQFFAAEGIIDATQAVELTSDDALDEFTQLPETRAIRRAAFTQEQEASLRAQSPDVFAEALIERAAQIAGYLKLQEEPATLKDKQKEALDALARGKDLLAVLPTGYGKSFVYQLPALALPGVTIVISPLVSLMTDQALDLNKTIGGAVRALVAPMRESNSRTGKTEIHQQLTDPNCRRGIRIIYLSPERLCQRQFQDWIRSGVNQGIVRRIAIDEAHTFVQWGDDFRPSFRRGEQFLRELKRGYSKLQLIALTATANKPVRQGLRRAIFGLAREAVDPRTFAYVSANPIRPELAIYRRTLGPNEGGHLAVSGLIEHVVDKLDDHAILYCLTVKEVDAVYVHLQDYLDDQRDRVRKYHGRMTEAEKTSVANDFKNAPKKDEEGFRPMIVVATSAFGLGIDRPDIRTVFVVSPPTDMAALYQQLGRAGRDQVDRPADKRMRTIGLALATNKAFRTISFMTQRAVDAALHTRMAASILSSDSPLDLRQIARDLIEEDYKAHMLTDDQAADRNIEDQYHINVTRMLAELAAAGLVEDLGDFPTTVDIRRGEVTPDTPEMAEIVDAILAMPPAKLRSVHLKELYERLASSFSNELPDHGALWTLILNLHTLGHLEVSQMPNVGQGYRTAVRIINRILPEGFIDRLSQRQRTIAEEFHELVAWYGSQECANEGLRRYFGVQELPAGTCETADGRCSTCWNQAARIRPGDEEPPLLEAFRTVRPQSASAAGEPRKRDLIRLDRCVERLLWHNYRGLGEYLIWAVLKGDEFYFNTRTQRRETLWPRLLNNNVYNARPGLRREELRASLERLESQGIITRDGGFWRLVRYVKKDAEHIAAVADGRALGAQALLVREHDRLAGASQADDYPQARGVSR